MDEPSFVIDVEDLEKDPFDVFYFVDCLVWGIITDNGRNPEKTIFSGEGEIDPQQLKINLEKEIENLQILNEQFAERLSIADEELARAKATCVMALREHAERNRRATELLKTVDETMTEAILKIKPVGDQLESDDALRSRYVEALRFIGAKNSLESLCFNMKQTVDDEKIKGKLSEDERQKISAKCAETLSWLDSNQTAEKEEFEHHQKELEAVCNPIISKMYQSAGGDGGMPGGMPNMGGAGAANGAGGPTIEEVD